MDSRNSREFEVFLEVNVFCFLFSRDRRVLLLDASMLITP